MLCPPLTLPTMQMQLWKKKKKRKSSIDIRLKGLYPHTASGFLSQTCFRSVIDFLFNIHVLLLHKASHRSKSNILLSYPPRRSLMRIFWFLDIQRPSLGISRRSAYAQTRSTQTRRSQLCLRKQSHRIKRDLQWPSRLASLLRAGTTILMLFFLLGHLTYLGRKRCALRFRVPSWV